MDCNKTLDFLKECARYCVLQESCEDCFLRDICLEISNIKGEEKLIIANLQKWSDEHPLKTYAQDFLKKLPNAKKDTNGAPSMCRARCYGTERPDSCGETWYCCSDCWNEPMEVKND